jgi:hypothetical protein
MVSQCFEGEQRAVVCHRDSETTTLALTPRAPRQIHVVCAMNKVIGNAAAE